MAGSLQSPSDQASTHTVVPTQAITHTAYMQADGAPLNYALQKQLDKLHDDRIRLQKAPCKHCPRTTELQKEVKALKDTISSLEHNIESLTKSRASSPSVPTTHDQTPTTSVSLTTSPSTGSQSVAELKKLIKDFT
jgi:hypothetical protein